ncbi:MAG: hypothetical protein RLZ13_1884, partial [Bacteroidota bacterium]
MNQQPNPTCLNCDEPLSGNFCQQCGQQKLPLKQSVGELLLVFFGEFFNYDGRFLRSIRLMLSQPGAITLAYLEGKRTSYVNPVRFYLFTSAIYFLVINYLVIPTLDTSPSFKLPSQVQQSSSEGAAMGFFDGVNEGLAAAGNSEDGELIQTEFESFQEFKANQDSLAPKDRVSALELRFVEKFYEVKEKYGDSTSFTSALGKEVVRRLPQLLLITLPILALISKLVFFRRKHYWYIDHLVFILHAATSLFFLLFVQQGIEYVARSTEQGWLEYLSQLLSVVWLGYYLMSFKR